MGRRAALANPRHTPPPSSSKPGLLKALQSSQTVPCWAPGRAAAHAKHRKTPAFRQVSLCHVCLFALEPSLASFPESSRSRHALLGTQFWTDKFTFFEPFKKHCPSVLYSSDENPKSLFFPMQHPLSSDQRVPLSSAARNFLYFSELVIFNVTNFRACEWCRCTQRG